MGNCYKPDGQRMSSPLQDSPLYKSPLATCYPSNRKRPAPTASNQHFYTPPRKVVVRKEEDWERDPCDIELLEPVKEHFLFSESDSGVSFPSPIKTSMETEPSTCPVSGMKTKFG